MRAKKGHTAFTLALILGLVLVAILVAAYASLLGTRLALGFRFRPLGPAFLARGELALVEWDVSPENLAQNPAEKIEFCPRADTWAGCTVLTPSTPNDGEALVAVPSTIPEGRGFLRLTARNAQGALITARTSTTPVSIRTATTLQPGQRVAVVWRANAAYPEAKIEFCAPRRRGTRCRTLAARVENTGRAELTVPRGISPRESGVILVRARGADGRLALAATPSGPRFVEQPAARIARPQRFPRVVAAPPPAEEPGGGGPGGPGAPPAPPPPFRPRPSAVFVSPPDGHLVQRGTPLSAQVQLTFERGNDPTCQAWKLDERLLTRSDWFQSQSPDESDGECL